MRELFLVAKHEYLRMVRRRSFLLGTLGVPLLITVIMTVAISVSVGNRDDRPAGYVDLAGVLDPSLLPSLDGSGRAVEMRPFADLAAARVALEEGEIQACYLLPADYLEVGLVELYYWDDTPSDAVWEQFDNFVRASLIADRPQDVQHRVMEGVSLTIRSADGRREANSEEWIGIVLPFGAAFFFMIAVMSSAGYLLQAVTTEKENRTMELMITSITPEQLVGGKALGLVGVSLTQLGIWVLAVVVGLIVGAQFLEPLRYARVPWTALGISALFFFPAYALVAGIMTTIGSAVTETRQGQQIAGIVNLFFSAPFFFVVLFTTEPNSPLAVALTLFPTTAFLTVTVRWGFSVIPAWQLILSWALLVASAGGSVWVAARVLRAGMLRYGQRLSLRAVWQTLGARSER